MTIATAGTATSPPIDGAMVKFDPYAPVGNANNLKGLLEKMKSSIALMMPKHITPERLFKTFLVAANRNPVIFQCTQLSVMETVNRAAELGLDLSGTLGEAYPVPFKNKIKIPDGRGGTREEWVMQLQLIIGYRGLEKLAWQSGEVGMIDAEVVYERDSFIFRKGFDPKLEWEPYRGGDDRGQVVGAYALFITKLGGRMARFMPKSDIEKIRNGAKSADSPAWRNHWDEMARKTALRRVLKDAPLSTEKFVRAMEIDDEDHDLTNVLEAETTRPAGSAGLLKKLKGGEPEEVPEPSHIGNVAGEIIDQTTGEVETPEDAAAKAKVAEQAEKIKQNGTKPKTLEEAAGDTKPALTGDALYQARKAAKAKHGCKTNKKGCAEDGATYEGVGYLCAEHDPANPTN